MKVVIHSNRVARRGRQAILLSVAGLAVLATGLALSLFRPQQIVYAYSALVAGTLMSWLGIALSDKWLRPPRADKALADALKGAGRAYALFHWVLPAEHVLLTPSGLVVFAVFNQEGPVAVRGDRWHEGRPLWKRLFALGRRPVRNPERLLETEVEALRDALVAEDAELGDVPIEAVALFTYRGVSLTVEGPNVPALRTDDLRAWLREAERGRKLSPARRRRVELALDRLAEA